MSQKYDAIIIGGGHNGLTCAAYLAKSGRKVLVLERRHILGGAAVSDEIYPGFTYTVCSYVVSLLRAEVTRELELPKHGLQLQPIDHTFLPMDNGDCFVGYADAARFREEVKRHSKRDADVMPIFGEIMHKMALAVKPILKYSPPNLNKLGLRDLKTLKDFGQHLHGLGKDNFHHFYKMMTMSADDFVGEYIETDIIRAMYGLIGVIGTMLSPKSPGSAYVLLHHYMGELDGAYSAWGSQTGGTGGVSETIANAARSLGVEIRVNTTVDQVIVKNGSAAGVALENGDEIYADTVVSGCDPKVTFRKLVEEKELPSELLATIDKFKYRGSSGKVNLALDGLPNFPAMKEKVFLRGGIDICPTVNYIEKAYDDAKYASYSRRPAMEISIPTMVDPTMAPPGKHVMSIFCQYINYDMDQHGTREQQRELFGDAVVDTLSDYCPNIKDIMLHRQVLTPKDLEEQFSLTEGNIFHGELTLDQLFFFRPATGWSNHRTPIRGYYQCGSATHPGGGITCGPGRMAAKEILGKDFPF